MGISRAAVCGPRRGGGLHERHGPLRGRPGPWRRWRRRWRGRGARRLRGGGAPLGAVAARSRGRGLRHDGSVDQGAGDVHRPHVPQGQQCEDDERAPDPGEQPAAHLDAAGAPGTRAPARAQPGRPRTETDVVWWREFDEAHDQVARLYHGGRSTLRAYHLLRGCRQAPGVDPSLPGGVEPPGRSVKRQRDGRSRLLATDRNVRQPRR